MNAIRILPQRSSAPSEKPEHRAMGSGMSPARMEHPIAQMKKLVHLLPTALAGIAVFGWVDPACAQNLLANGDFENYTQLPNNYGQTDLAVGWTNVNGNYSGPPYASPDYFHLAGGVGSFFGQIQPYSGAAQMGFATYSSNLSNFREYISSAFSCPMEPGRQYRVSFYLSNGHNGLYSKRTNAIGACFSVAPLAQLVDEPIPAVPQLEVATLVDHDNYWQQYEFTYTATEASNYITIGNFRDDANTLVTPVGSTGAYYFIDKIEVSPITDGAASILGEDTTLCIGQTLLLDATTGNANYTWQDGSTGPTYTVVQQGVYWVNVSNTCMDFTDSIAVGYTILPVLDLGGDTALCPGSSITLACAAATDCLWSTGVVAPSVNITAPGSYWAQVTEGQCSTTAYVLIAEESSCGSVIEMPNVFTPNHDGHNEGYGPLVFEGIEKADLTIFNRWGMVMFHTGNVLAGWDGRANGTPCPEGIYYWVLHYRTTWDEPGEKSGYVQLVR
ncbi:MAG: gliding motility-associated C-terminal domain-containing protein [Flavobacteriales bacterium]|nr:gliding motility-associated C-terminal domain-containing protein [Flavobacteriales bacterium]